MAQGTGQARRRNAGTEKASGKKTQTQSRGATGSRQRSGTGSNGKAASSGRAAAKSTSGSNGKAASSGRTAAKSKSGSNGRTASAAKSSGGKSRSPARRKSTARGKSPARAKSAAGRASGALKQLAAPEQLSALKKLGSSKKLGTPKQLDMVKKLDKGKALDVVKAARPIMHIPKVAEYARTAALRAGTAGAALTAARVATATVKRRRQESRLTRMQKKIPSLRRRRRRRLPKPELSLPQLSLLRFSLPELPDPVELVSDHPETLWLAAVPAGVGAARVVRRGRRLPIQQCVDIAVPLQLAYDEWMRLEFLPEGSHTVEQIERDGRDALTGRLKGRPWPRKWEAEIRDERDCESFAWRSVKGSDCAGLVTFHELGDRLTRLELQLDIVPVRPLEAAELALRMADARARNDLRRFKARLETISPDAYPESTPTSNNKES